MRRGSARRALVAAVALVGATVLIAGCGSDGSEGSDGTSGSTTTTAATGATEPAPVTGPATAEALDGRSYVSQSVEGRELVAGTTLTLSFDDGTLSANAGCNTMNGPYEVDEGRLRWTETPAATMMGCDEDRMVQDQQIVQLLKGGVDATLDGDELTLATPNVTIVLLDQRQAEPDQPLVGTMWTLDSIIEGDTVSSVPADAEPATLTISDDGQAQVFAGCNRGGGTATVGQDGSSVEFGPIALTRMACEGSAAEVEAAVTAVLDGTVEVVLEGGSLTLTNGDQGLVFTAS